MCVDERDHSGDNGGARGWQGRVGRLGGPRLSAGNASLFSWTSGTSGIRRGVGKTAGQWSKENVASSRAAGGSAFFPIHAQHGSDSPHEPVPMERVSQHACELGSQQERWVGAKATPAAWLIIRQHTLVSQRNAHKPAPTALQKSNTAMRVRNAPLRAMAS
jgi:hypothetical protein